MKLIFTQEQIEKELNKVHLEEDNVVMEGEYVIKEEENYAIIGVATIDGERFQQFKVTFELVETVEETIENIMNTEWDWYDFDFR